MTYLCLTSKTATFNSFFYCVSYKKKEKTVEGLEMCQYLRLRLLAKRVLVHASQYL
jgi:hypothetical protein